MTFDADIPLALAQSAHAGTSHVPEQRGAQERASYAATLAADLAMLERLATDDSKRATLTAEFARYREGFRRRFVARLAAQARCISPLVTGPARFPVARNRKRSDAADKRTQELIDFREAALRSIKRALCPELAPIMAGDRDALARLRVKLAALEADRAAEKAANAAVRKACKALGRPATQTDHLAIVAALTAPEPIRKALASAARAFPWAPQFGPNTGAEIRRCEQRIKALEIAKATPDAAIGDAAPGTGIRAEESAADHRVRIYFPDKPAAEIRRELKSAGFRWAPSVPGKPWQAYPSAAARQLAARMTAAPPAAAAAPVAQGGACACESGGFCDVAHDPAACGCGRCS